MNRLFPMLRSKQLMCGDPLIKEKMDLDVDVARLKVLRADHMSQQYRLEDQLLKYFPAEIKSQESLIRGMEADIRTAESHPQVKDGFCRDGDYGKTLCGKRRGRRSNSYRL